MMQYLGTILRYTLEDLITAMHVNLVRIDLFIQLIWSALKTTKQVPPEVEISYYLYTSFYMPDIVTSERERFVKT